MATTLQRTSLAFAAVIALAGCSDFIKKDQYDTDIAALKSADQNLQSQIDALSQKYDTLAQEVAGRVRIETGAHFATGDATLGEQDKPFLADFASAVGKRPDAVVTVEGFADPQGATKFNRNLGMQRANAVSEYLAANGMSASQLRTVSYGEDTNRQVRPGQIGPEGADNRRVSLVIDFAGATAAAPMPAPAPAPATEPATEPMTEPATEPSAAPEEDAGGG